MQAARRWRTDEKNPARSDPGGVFIERRAWGLLTFLRARLGPKQGDSMRTLVGVACLFLLTGCAKNFVQPALNAPHAKVAMRATVNSWTMTHPAQVFSYFETPNCDNSGRPNRLAYLFLSGSREVEVRIPVGRIAYLRGMTSEYWVQHGYTKTYYNTGICANIASFYPRAGERYSVRHLVAGDQCSLEVLDASGQAPDDIEFLPVDSRCLDLNLSGW